MDTNVARNGNKRVRTLVEITESILDQTDEKQATNDYTNDFSFSSLFKAMTHSAEKSREIGFKTAIKLCLLHLTLLTEFSQCVYFFFS